MNNSSLIRIHWLKICLSACFNSFESKLSAENFKSLFSLFSVVSGIEFNLSGEDVGFVIGRRGETLDSLQYLTSLVANHSDNSFESKLSAENFKSLFSLFSVVSGINSYLKIAVVRVVGNKACKVLK